MFDEQTTGIKVSRQTLYDQVWSIPMARFNQEANQINGLFGHTNMRTDLIHWSPDSFLNCVYFESLTSQAG